MITLENQNLQYTNAVLIGQSIKLAVEYEEDCVELPTSQHPGGWGAGDSSEGPAPMTWPLGVASLGGRRCGVWVTWFASPSCRSTCPSAGGGCWGSRPRSGRTAASQPASRARGPGHSDTWCCRNNSAAAAQTSWCRHLCHRCWMSASGNPWASGRKCPADSHTPACLALPEGWKTLYTGVTLGCMSLNLIFFFSPPIVDGYSCGGAQCLISLVSSMGFRTS